MADDERDGAPEAPRDDVARQVTQRLPAGPVPGGRPVDETDPDGPTWRLPPPPPPSHWGPPPPGGPQRQGASQPYGGPQPNAGPQQYAPQPPGGYGPPPPQWGPPPQHQAGYGPPQQYGAYAPPGYGQQPYGQARYGQQPYGGYGPPPGGPAPQEGRRWTRGRLVVLLAVAAVVVAAGVTAIVLLTRGGGDRVLSTSAVERDVAQQFQAEQGVPVRLTCDSHMPLVTGATYSCRGTTAEGEQVTLTIRVTDARAATYTWSER